MENKKYNLNVLVFILATIPILLWLNAPATQPRFDNLQHIIVSIGQICALAGTILFAINLILSTRLPWLEKKLASLNVIYIRHSQLGQIALMLLLVHPLLLLPKYANNIHEAAAFFSLSNDWSINWGIISLGMMLCLIILTLYLKPRYDIWKWTHKFLGLAFFLASVHIWLIPSDVSMYTPLRWYVLGFAILGLMAFLYKSVFGEWLVKKYNYTVSNIKHLSNHVSEISLQPKSIPIKFNPGQFIFISFRQHGFSKEEHPFSITANNKEDLSIAVKNLGDYTSTLQQLKIGAPAKIEGPFGEFNYQNSSHTSQIWIAGGIGITPFISMAKSLDSNHDYDIDLYYCAKNANEAPYTKKLLEINNNLSRALKIFNFYSEEKGRITAKYIEQNSKNIKDRDIFLCAPPSMIKALKQQFLDLGINADNIHSEEFNL